MTTISEDAFKECKPIDVAKICGETKQAVCNHDKPISDSESTPEIPKDHITRKETPGKLDHLYEELNNLRTNGNHLTIGFVQPGY